MTSQDTQERDNTSAIPSVPEGTPGRDPRAELPTPLPPGAQQPWRRHGPGNRTWVVVITALAGVVMAVVGVFAVGFGFANNAFDRTGAVVLFPTEYRPTEKACSGAGDAAEVKKGAKVVFRNSKTSFESTLGGGELRGGRCVFRFELSALDVDTDLNYRVTVGGVEGTPVSGAELANSSDPVVVYVS
ncbi:hypothetical protein [Tsukamurella pseudospumae]|uniref:Uncharacterized protein n=1 Tax=Tsukamurella pseudospumae TaxID=239498 RepID=A0A138AVJ4_9ACTN|nr:hypothetical protein [Tsukamurella pseudospumae]KXO91285.1 hypothetical protein AXK61_06945 [Tsukamurella pseudospumae]KXP14419.1 hypothetical protein AXK60_00455 [Tsukamurella pseudospumae]